MTLDVFELAQLDSWLDGNFETQADRIFAKTRILIWLDTQEKFPTELADNGTVHWRPIYDSAAKQKITTFAELWEKLSKYSDFHVYCETYGDSYNAISLGVIDYDEDEGEIEAFRLQNSDDTMDDITISPLAQLKDLGFVDNNLAFLVEDSYTGTEVELWLQVRIAPQIEI
jgi:hypothetical protein